MYLGINFIILFTLCCRGGSLKMFYTAVVVEILRIISYRVEGITCVQGYFVTLESHPYSASLRAANYLSRARMRYFALLLHKWLTWNIGDDSASIQSSAHVWTASLEYFISLTLFWHRRTPGTWFHMAKARVSGVM